ncbi:hypothetical protein ACLOJK_027493 [Asimina triloba]
MEIPERMHGTSAVCGKDIISTASDLVFFFSTIAHKKVGHPTPFEKIEAGSPTQRQWEERSLPHNAVAIKPLPVVDEPPPKDRTLSNSSDQLGESPNNLVTRAKLHALLQMMKFFQQQMVRAQPNTTPVPSATSTGVPSPLASTALTLDMAPIAHHLQATS